MSKRWQIVIGVVLLVAFSWWLTTEQADSLRNDSAAYVSR